jgi:DNA-binding MarR family transcriptional regulator
MDTLANTAPKGLASEIGKRKAFASLRQEAYLNLLRTHAKLAAEFSRLYKTHGLTDPKYNALRILQGEGRPMQIYQIADRMVTPHTDVTRLVERLTAEGFVDRQRCESDRRVVWVRLNAKGKALLKKLEKPVMELHEIQFPGFTNEELEQINHLLLKARSV